MAFREEINNIHTLMENLNDDLKWNVYKFLRNPICDMISKEVDMYVIRGDIDCWDEFVKIHLRRYRNKCRKKPKHFKVMEMEIKCYKYYVSYCKKHNHKPLSFHKNIFQELRSN